MSRIQHCCSGQFFFKIQYSCFGQYSGYSGHSTVVPSSILAFQNIVQLFRAVFWVFRIQHTCSGQFSGCSGYCTVVRGSYLVFRNTLKFIRAVFRVLSKQQGCFGLFSGDKDITQLFRAVFQLSGYSTVVPDSIIGVQDTTSFFWAVYRVFKIQHSCPGQYYWCSGYNKLFLGSIQGVQNTA